MSLAQMLRWRRWENWEEGKMGLTKTLAVVAGGRNEETNSKYAAGVRVKQLPSRRQ